MLKKTFIFLITSILLQSCSLFTDPVEIVCRINSNESKHVLFEKGDYLLLEKFTTHNQGDVLSSVNASAIIISKESSKQIISGESIIMVIESVEYLLKDKITIEESKEYSVSTLKIDEGFEYLIVKSKPQI